MSDAVTTIGWDNTEAQAGANQFDAIANRAAGGLEGAFKKVGGVLAGVFALSALKDFGVSAVQEAAKMEGIQNSLVAVSGSAELAQTELDKLREAGRLPGLSFEAAVKGSARLQAVRFSALQARNILVQLGNAIALSGGGGEDLEEITDALTDIVSAGTITDEKIDRLTERSALLSRVMQDTFGASTAQGLRDLGVNAQDFIIRLAGGLELLERAPDTLANKLKNTNDKITQLKASIGKTAQPAVETSLEFFDGMIKGISEGSSKAQDAASVLWSWLSNDPSLVGLANAAAINAKMIGDSERSVALERERGAAASATASNLAEQAQLVARARKEAEAYNTIVAKFETGRTKSRESLEKNLNSEQEKTSNATTSDPVRLERDRMRLLEINKILEEQKGLAATVSTEEALNLEIQRESLIQSIATLEDKVAKSKKDADKVRDDKLTKIRSLEDELALLELISKGRDKEAAQLSRDLGIKKEALRIQKEMGVSAEQALSTAKKKADLEDKADKRRNRAGQQGDPNERKRIQGFKRSQMPPELANPFRNLDKRQTDLQNRQFGSGRADTPSLDKRRAGLQARPFGVPIIPEIKQPKRGKKDNPLEGKAAANAQEPADGSLVALNDIKTLMQTANQQFASATGV